MSVYWTIDPLNGQQCFLFDHVLLLHKLPSILFTILNYIYVLCISGTIKAFGGSLGFFLKKNISQNLEISSVFGYFFCIEL